MSKTNENKIIIINELALKLWRHLKPYQFVTNLKWLEQVHRLTKEGGLWIYSDRNLTFRKRGNGFIQLN